MTRTLLTLCLLFGTLLSQAQKAYEKQSKGKEFPKDIKQSELLIFSPFKEDKARHQKLEGIAATYSGKSVVVASNSPMPMTERIDPKHKYFVLVFRDVQLSQNENQSTYSVSLWNAGDPKLLQMRQKAQAAMASANPQAELAKLMMDEKALPEPMISLSAQNDWDGMLTFLLGKLNESAD
ncbi:MAG: hypothetical protein EOO16_12600 [Chitinophagaceae bacterium]|nr:MAG: hypothetical protein EOO16_12600 [Chitinophagaceae bacterium]